MKKLIVILMLVLPFAFINAQTTDDEIEYIQSIFGMEKRAAVSEYLELDDNEKEAFWKHYDAYEVQRKVYGKERIILLDKFVTGYESMSEEDSGEWMKAVIALRKKNEKLIEKYYKQIAKDCSPTVGMQFYQIESYLLAGIRFQILENMPF